MRELKRRIYRFADFQLDATNRQLRRGGETLTLPAKAFDLLQTLLENSGRLVEKDELFASVWRDQIVEESNLTVHISQIRKALGETKKNPRFIETVPGYGYRFIGEATSFDDEEDLVIETETLSRITVEREEETANGHFIAESETEDNLKSENSNPTNISLKIENQTDKEQNSKTKIQRPYFLVFGGVAVLLVLGFGGFWFVKQKQQNRAGFVPIVSAERQARIKRLTTNGRVNIAVISPDGRFFAYSVYEKARYRSEIRLGQTNASGSDATLVPMKTDAVYNPTSFSADGNWLYFVQNKPRDFDNGTLYKIPVLPGGVPQKLATGVNIYPAISPDERQIAFVRASRERKTSSLIVANLDGAGEREIVARPLGEAIRGLSLSWSADGASIAFSAATGEKGSREVFTVNAADGSVAQLTSLNWVEILKLEWLKDKSGLLAVARDKDSTALTQVWQIDYPTGAARKITHDLFNYASAASVATDASAFVAVNIQSESNVWVAPAANLRQARQITFGSPGRQDGWFGLDWTPDGQIVYTAWIDQSSTVWTMDADGANARQLTPAGFQDKQLSVSADGSFVVFQSNRSGASDIWRVDADGGNLSQLTMDGGNSSPSLSPDGKWLFYQHTEGGENSIWRVSLAGGEPIRITDKNSVSPRVSPDGKFIACGYTAADGKMRLAVIPIEGGEPAKLFDAPPTYNFDNAAIRWSPDSRFIAYRDWSNGVWRQPVEGGEPKLLEGLPDEKLYTYGWSSDGKLFAFTRGREVRDAVLISDFK